MHATSPRNLNPTRMVASGSHTKRCELRRSPFPSSRLLTFRSLTQPIRNGNSTLIVPYPPTSLGTSNTRKRSTSASEGSGDERTDSPSCTTIPLLLPKRLPLAQLLHPHPTTSIPETRMAPTLETTTSLPTRREEILVRTDTEERLETKQNGRAVCELRA